MGTKTPITGLWSNGILFVAPNQMGGLGEEIQNKAMKLSMQKYGGTGLPKTIASGRNYGTKNMLQTGPPTNLSNSLRTLKAPSFGMQPTLKSQ